MSGHGQQPSTAVISERDFAIMMWRGFRLLIDDPACPPAMQRALRLIIRAYELRYQLKPHPAAAAVSSVDYVSSDSEAGG